MRSVMSGCLRFVGFDVQQADDVPAADEIIGIRTPSLLMLSDRTSAAGSGLLKRLRAKECQTRVPVIVLTDERRPKDSDTFADHADEYLPRNTAPHVLVETVEGLLRSQPQAARISAAHFAGLELSLHTRLLQCNGKSVTLGPTEHRLLAFFIGNPERVFSRAQLLERLWAYSVRVEERTIDVHIRRLREALMQVGCERFVQTVPRVGYRLSAHGG